LFDVVAVRSKRKAHPRPNFSKPHGLVRRNAASPAIGVLADEIADPGFRGLLRRDPSPPADRPLGEAPALASRLSGVLRTRSRGLLRVLRGRKRIDDLALLRDVDRAGEGGSVV